MLRAMIAVGLGCDTLPKGMKELSVVKISQEMNSQETKFAEKLATFYEKCSSYPASLYKALSMAILFEPANIMKES